MMKSMRLLSVIKDKTMVFLRTESLDDIECEKLTEIRVQADIWYLHPKACFDDISVNSIHPSNFLFAFDASLQAPSLLIITLSPISSISPSIATFKTFVKTFSRICTFKIETLNFPSGSLTMSKQDHVSWSTVASRGAFKKVLRPLPVSAETDSQFKLYYKLVVGLKWFK
ncbi:uncharacterized protein EV154DRAFT_486742 [Mucor mucedo]|uniref:uncharacterized protein n=1 Tax=Mucor mucedo TaxID=29922 RepID=UPI00221FF9AB|nr:uncharacterized protein EV154DRAFT_486742 [Mucor mucedo]KAI7875446.1 hypothetical protein EV154DRAFT_486742 [Mucor mucedo]